MSAYINEDLKGASWKPVDSAYRCEANVEGKNVTHQILDSDGKVLLFTIPIFKLLEIEEGNVTAVTTLQ